MNQKLKKQFVKTFAVLFSAATLFTVANPQTSYAMMGRNQKRDRSESQKDDGPGSPKRLHVEQQPGESSEINEDQQNLNDRLLICAKEGRLTELKDNLTELISLLDNDADVDVNAKDNDGNIALMWAAFHGHIDIINRLIYHGANVNLQNNNDKTALIWAAQGGHTDTVKALLDNGAEVNVKDLCGHTALMWAATYGYTDIVNLLLKKDAKVNAKDNGEWTALMMAAGGGHTETVITLLNNGAEVNAQSNDHETALRMAVRNGHTDTVKALLDTGKIDHSLRDSNGITDCQVAMDLHRESFCEHFRIIKMFLDHGDRPASSDIRDRKAIILLSAIRNDVNLLTALKSSTADGLADCNFKDSEYGRTPLMWAAINGSNENFCYSLFRFFGYINVNEQDNDGNTALIYAVKYNHPKFVKFLISEIINCGPMVSIETLNIRNKKGRDVNTYARRMGYRDFFDWLNNSPGQ